MDASQMKGKGMNKFSNCLQSVQCMEQAATQGRAVTNTWDRGTLCGKNFICTA